MKTYQGTSTMTLNDGESFPTVGLGVWKAEGQVLRRAVAVAVEAGYRHIDCASLYGNEAEVAKILRDLGTSVKSQVKVTTKIWTDDVRKGDTLGAVRRSMKLMKVDMLDVVLIHWPVKGYLQAWEDLQVAKQKDLVRTIGVSNFMPKHLDQILSRNETVPSINQFEHHPYLPQKDARVASQARSIYCIAHTPLMQGSFLQEPKFGEIAQLHGVTPAQVILRWNLQHGVGIIPKSTTSDRIRENIDLFNFELTEKDMSTIDNLERSQRYSGDPYSIDF